MTDDRIPEPRHDDDIDELGMALWALESRLGDPSWNTADGRSVIVPRDTLREVTAALRAALRAALARQDTPDRTIRFSGTVVEWPDEGRRITVEVGPDCWEYPAIGETVSVVRHAQATPDPDDWTALANDIRIVDGNHDLGAGELAARLVACGWRRQATPASGGLDVDVLDTFVGRARDWMRQRLEHGARKFGRFSWRETVYTDFANEERLRRAVDHLIAARGTTSDPDEWAKRAADVANQAFMYADEDRLRARLTSEATS